MYHLLPAHLIQVDLSTGTCSVPRQWWSPTLEESTELGFHDTAEFVRSEFLRSVKFHLRSDVPVGAALSGGLDSSALVCAMRHLDPNMEIKTFSFVARGHEFSEEPWINEINKSVGAIPHKLELSSHDIAQDLDDLVCSQGEPFGTPAVFGQYRIFRLAKESGISVTLDGQGADELFAGYNGYPEFRLMSLFETGQPLKAIQFSRAWSRWPGRTWLTPWRDFSTLFRIRAGRPPSSPLPNWINQKFVRDTSITTQRAYLQTGEEPKRRWVTVARRDALTRTGIPHFLRHADRASMRFSVESRVPFLTLPLAQLGLSLPESFVISDEGETKSIFREAMRDIVPERVLYRRDKIGFITPEKAWLHQLCHQVRAWLLESKSIPIFNHMALLEQFDRVIKGDSRFDWHPWTWIFFIKWYQQQGFD